MFAFNNAKPFLAALTNPDSRPARRHHQHAPVHRLVIQINADDRVRPQTFRLLAHLQQSRILGFAQNLLVSLGTPAHEIPDSSQEIPEHIGPDDGFARNDAVILVESAEKGGGLVTAGIALSYSRDVFALPGKTTDKYSAGCNALIGRNAAAIITSPSCISEALNWNDSAAVSRKERLMQLFEKSDYIRRNILLALSADSAVDRNTIIEKAGADPQEVLARLTEMEMEGTVGSDIFGNYILKV